MSLACKVGNTVSATSRVQLVVPTHDHEVDDALEINLVAKVLVVASREASPDAVVNVHHACDSVKSEPVELIFLHPEPEVRKQESEDFVMTVVEEAAVFSVRKGHIQGSA